MRPALVIVHLAIEFYVQDIKTLVINGVNTWIKESKEKDTVTKDTIKDVTQALARWQLEKHPFEHDQYLLLCHLIRPGTVSLPPSSSPQLTLRTFLDSLIKRGLQGTKTGAPFLKGGSFQHVLPVALHKLQKYAITQSFEPLPLMAEVLESVWLLFKLHHIPWTAPPNPEQRRGRPATLVVYTAWSQFGGPRDPKQHPNALRPLQQRAAVLEQNMQLALSRDADGPWNTDDITIQDIHKILHRHVLPEDWVLPEAKSNEKGAYVAETYRYVKDNFALPEPLYQLALIMGLVFSKLTPNVFTAKPGDIPPTALSTHRSTHAFLNTLEWETRSKKGLSQQNIFVSMVATYIIAIYDPHSPLRKYFDKHQQMGDSWTMKHGK
jgi:hypothetical protein